jgi:hypothetical protein
MMSRKKKVEPYAPSLSEEKLVNFFYLMKSVPTRVPLGQMVECKINKDTMNNFAKERHLDSWRA